MRIPPLLLVILAAVAGTACAGPRFRTSTPDGSVAGTGFRVYPPKPYLVVVTSWTLSNKAVIPAGPPPTAPVGTSSAATSSAATDATSEPNKSPPSPTRTRTTTSEVILLPDLNDPQLIIPRGNGKWAATLERGMVKTYREENSSEALEAVDKSAEAFVKLLELAKQSSKRDDTAGGARTGDVGVSSTPRLADDPPPLQLFEIRFGTNGCMELIPVPQGECDRLCGRIAQLPAIQRLPK